MRVVDCMKVKEVPQDGKMLIDSTLLYYAVNDEGGFEKVQSSGWEPGYQAHLNIIGNFKAQAEKAKERIKNGLASPLEYFMYNSIQNVDNVTQCMGISKRKVKKHLTPKGFEKLDDKMLERYALLFVTDVETIKNFKSTLK
jgi:hypothetical protein